MNLRFTPTALALELYVSSVGGRRIDEALLGSELADNSSPYRINGGGDDNENIITSRQHSARIAASMFEHGIATYRRQRLYYPEVGILQGGKSRRRLLNGRVQRDADSVPNVNVAPRFLQAKETPMCGTNGTCLPSACTCRANGGVINIQFPMLWIHGCKWKELDNGRVLGFSRVSRSSKICNCYLLQHVEVYC
jgi:hypothetical protein